MRIFILCLLLLPMIGFAADLHDPTRPDLRAVILPADGAGLLDRAPGEAEPLVLQAIFFHPGNSGVLINGQHYAEGDLLANVQQQVIAIQADKVMIKTEQGELELRLPLPVVKTTKNKMHAEKIGNEQ